MGGHERRGRGGGPPQGLGDLVPRVLEELGFSEASLGSRLLRVWDEALGPDLAPHCRPEGFRRGVVQASVADSAWMQRLQMERPRVLEALRELLGAPELDLRFKIMRAGEDPPAGEVARRSPGSGGRSGSSA